MRIQIETITLKDGSKMDVIRDIDGVCKMASKLEDAQQAIKALLQCDHGTHEIPSADGKALRAVVYNDDGRLGF